MNCGEHYGNPADNVKKLLRNAEEEYSWAQYQVASLHLKGAQGFKDPNLTEAVKYFQLAADQG